jgi:tetratricopeptide (TPR) repeat protein
MRQLIHLLLLLYLFGISDALKSTDIDTNSINNKVAFYLKTSFEIGNRNIDSSSYFAEKAKHYIGDLKSDTLKASVFIQLAEIASLRGKFPQSLDYCFKAKALYDDALHTEEKGTRLVVNQINLAVRIGVAYFHQRNYDQALKYYEEGLNSVESLVAKDKSIDLRTTKIKILNNIAGVYIQKSLFDRALEYYKTAIELNTNPQNEAMQGSLTNNIGICYLEKKEFGLAIHYFQESLAIRTKLGDKRGEAQCYNNIGKNHVYLGKFNDAKAYFNNALAIGREIGNNESQLISLQSLSSVYDTLGEYKLALKAFIEFKTLSDSVYSIESAKRIEKLEQEYKFEKQQKIFDLEFARQAAAKEKGELIYLIIGIALFFLLLTALLILFLQKSKLRNSILAKEKVELQHKHLSLEKRQLNEQLEYKERELATNALYLLKKNELLTNISEKLIQSKSIFKNENQKIIQDIVNELKSSLDHDIWEEFEAHFTHVHKDFYVRLMASYPSLSSNERKLCAFLKLNMSTKDISAITYQSVNSITVARSRLRKKLNIEGEDIQLVDFLMQF